MVSELVARGALAPDAVPEARERLSGGTIASTALIIAGAPPESVLHALSSVSGAPPAPPPGQWTSAARAHLGVDEGLWHELLAVPVGALGERPLVAFAEVARMGSSLARALPDHVPCVALEGDVLDALAKAPTLPPPSAAAFLAPPQAVAAALRVGASPFGGGSSSGDESSGSTSSATFVVAVRGEAKRASSSSPRLVGPSTRAGRFTLQRVLGRGGMATVYLGTADDGGEPKEAAIKVLHDHLLQGNEGDKLRRRFQREVETMRQLAHPNIVACVDAGRVADTEFFAAEYVSRGSLRDLLNRTGKLPSSFVLVLLGELLEGLAHAHERGVVHRDLKPDNLLIAEGGTLKVADFGIARVAEGTTLTATGGTIGTPAYMSPEQALAQPVDARSDLYSTGVIAYEALTGRNPFQAGSTGATLANVVLGKVPPIGDVEASVPLLLDVVLARLMSLRPDDRLSSARAVLAALEPVLEGARPYRELWASLVAGDNRALGRAVVREADELAAYAREAAALDDEHRLCAGLAAFRATSLDPGHREAKSILSSLQAKGPLRFARSTTSALFELESSLERLRGDERRAAYRELAALYLEEHNPVLAASYLRRLMIPGAVDDDLARLAALLPARELLPVRTMRARVEGAE